MPAKGKHIKAAVKNVDGSLCMLLGSSKNKSVKTELFWAIRGEGTEPFTMVLTFPGLPDQASSAVNMALDAGGGQAAYANAARKCHPSDLPDDCPVVDILDQLDEAGDVPKPPKKTKTPKGD